MVAEPSITRIATSSSFLNPSEIAIGRKTAASPTSLINAAVADGLVTDWCAALDKLQDTAQAENWDSVRDDLSALHESWDAHATYFHIILQHDELNEVESLLARADSFAFEQDEGEFRACVAELKSQLLVLSEMQEISIQNIL